MTGLRIYTHDVTTFIPEKGTWSIFRNARTLLAYGKGVRGTVAVDEPELTRRRGFLAYLHD
jgi:hypothetical protein